MYQFTPFCVTAFAAECEHFQAESTHKRSRMYVRRGLHKLGRLATIRGYILYICTKAGKEIEACYIEVMWFARSRRGRRGRRTPVKRRCRIWSREGESGSWWGWCCCTSSRLIYSCEGECVRGVNQPRSRVARTVVIEKRCGGEI